MSLRNYVPVQEYDNALGMDSTSPLASMRPGYVRAAYNCNLGLVSGYIKRGGFSEVLDSDYTTYSFTSGLEFRTSGGSRRTMMYGVDGSSGRLVYVSGGAVTDVQTGLDGTARPSMVQVGDQLFFFNGSDNALVYDGTNIKQLGITKPAAAPTFAETTGGSLTQLARYIYAYTYYNATTHAESSPSAIGAHTLTATNSKLTLTVLAGDSDTADTIRIWRTVANGNELYLEGTAAIGATSYESTAADSALGRPIEYDNSRLADVTTAKGKFAVVAGNRIFVVTGENELRWSAIGLYEPKPESYQVQAVTSTLGTHGNNDGIVGLATIGELVVVLKRKSVGILTPIGTSDTTFPEDTQYFIYKEISSEIGAVSHFGACQIENELFFVGRNNIYRTDGQVVRQASETIFTDLRSMSYSSTQQPKISAINDTKYKRAYFQLFTDSSATVPTWTFVADYQRYPEARWTIYRPGTNTTTHPGLRVGCFVKVTNTSDGSDDVWFGNLDDNGQIYLMNDGTNDNEKGIYFRIVTRPFHMDQPILTKLFKKAYLSAQGDGSAYNLIVSAIYNLSDQEEAASSFSLSNGGAVWDGAYWDEATWPNSEVQPIEYSTHRKAKFQQLVFKQLDADAPVTLFGWASTGSIFGPH